MGYACPVCGEPQADGEHLANHLAFSALLGHADHEAWLDEHAPEWGDDGPAELAERVVPHAESADLPAVTGDATDLPDPEEPPGGFEGALARQSGPRPGRERVDPATRQALQEARAMTREQLDDEPGEGSADGSNTDASGGAGDGDASEERVGEDDETVGSRDGGDRTGGEPVGDGDAGEERAGEDDETVGDGDGGDDAGDGTAGGRAGAGE